MRTGPPLALRAILSVVLMTLPGRTQEPLLLERPPDPHGTPRPARDATDVPLHTSLYCELALPPSVSDDEVDPSSVQLQLEAAGTPPVALLGPGQKFQAGASGWLKRTQNLQGHAALALYVEPGYPLPATTRHTVHVQAATRQGKPLAGPASTWSFTTESGATPATTRFSLDLASPPVSWQGGFFTGLCNVIFCSEAKSYQSTYDLMNQARQQHPRAWTYQRDFWTTGTEFTRPGLLPQRLPNIVRERETRRIESIERTADGLLLRLDDVFGHDQYGVPADRPIPADYHPGDEVLLADGVHDARTRVRKATDSPPSLLVEPVDDPPDGWKLAYDGPLPTRENPDAPGLFPPGGCYVRKFNPSGTPCYYWDRLDHQYDLVHRQNGQRIMVNFADATGDLSRDGRSWTTAKDLAEWHEVVRTITDHLIDRYGDSALDFTWSVFNEPDLGPLFWRASWDDLQTFYDYTVDAVLRAFEDRGLDSHRVVIGGLELGGIFGTNLKLDEFLAHCSPTATAPGALPLNAAYADLRLAGRRSSRVETLCRAHAGKGTPCDFLSIHAYNRSSLMAAKLARARVRALEIDPDFYEHLRINSHESCPDWMPPPDEAAADSYLGNGYFETWCLDVVARQLRQGAADPRYARGETLLTVWPPLQDLNGLNAITRTLHYADGADTKSVTLASPVFHVLTLLSDLGPDYWILPEREAQGQLLSGFASRDGTTLHVVLYAHAPADTQSRSDRQSSIHLDLSGLGDAPLELVRYDFDRDHNSPYRPIIEARRHGAGSQRIGFLGPRRYEKAEVVAIQSASTCQPSDPLRLPAPVEGHVPIEVTLPVNGSCFLVIRPVGRASE